MKKFLIKLSYTGDLGNLALITFWPEYGQKIEEHEMKDTLFVKVNHTEDLRNIDVNVLTVGDSFSQQEHAGYQNYMPGEGLSVANCRRSLYDNPIQYAYNLMDWGMVDSTNVDVMVVEVGERDFALRIDNFGVDKVEVPEPDDPVEDDNEERNPNEWSLLRARDFVLYRFAGRSPVYVVDLKQDFFDSPEPRKLYFYCADIINGMTIDETIRHKVKEVFDLLTCMAQKRGIKLIFMLPVDKYDLYQDYIVDNPYAYPKRINEDVREILGDIPEVLLSKYYLQPLIDKGEKDIFLFDNSHWSYKASEVGVKELSRRIKLLID